MTLEEYVKNAENKKEKTITDILAIEVNKLKNNNIIKEKKGEK